MTRASITLAITLGLGVLVAGSQADSHALLRLAASERAFSATTAELGFRDGFLTFFAPDSVQIAPGLGGPDTRLLPAREGLEKQPLTPLPLGTILAWNPHTGQIADDQSIGWLTGPFVVTNPSSGAVAGQGAYFSVWKRQADGTYRVWLDEGVSIPEVWRDAADFLAAPPPAGGRGGAPAETIEQAEASVATGGDGWLNRWSDSVRIHRQGRMPLVGRSAAVPWSREVWTTVAFTPVHHERASSDDLAVTVGGYQATTAAGAEKGTWVRVWRRDGQGRWRIVFETSKLVA